jgi:hypothetical protein
VIVQSLEFRRFNAADSAEPELGTSTWNPELGTLNTLGRHLQRHRRHVIAAGTHAPEIANGVEHSIHNPLR